MLQRKDIARMVGCSVGTIVLWQKAGFLPAPARIGKPFLWTHESIRNFCKQKHMVKAYA